MPLQMYNHRDAPRRRVWEYISPNPMTSNWMVGNSQMAKFNGAQDYQILYKRGGRIEEIISQAEWLITTKGAKHVVIDGIQNSVTAITRGRLNKIEKKNFQKPKIKLKYNPYDKIL